MKLLAIDCSAKSASCAIIEGKKIIASAFVNTNLTHSQTLLPMVSGALSASKTDINEIGAFAVSAGPGSFTGIRIGISAIKGMATAKNIPCVSVSTLYAIAENFIDRDALICAVMDARCNQFYCGLFRVKNGKIKRLCEDKAEKADVLADEILKSRVNCPIIIAGDGAEIFFDFVKKKNNTFLAEEHLRYQNGVGVAFAGLDAFKKGEYVSSEKLLPVYLRLPQAERELKNKQKKE